MSKNANAPSAPPPPTRIAHRYAVKTSLGQGGMARVYEVTDEVSGRALALKQLLPPSSAKRAAVIALFEAEFHTLAQLSHPRVVEVYDYGLDEAGPFYTMELLEGGDLSDRSPLPWREACALIYDVCSCLALLHSRRFVHRDVSPRNIRCTSDGHAKLIDFGTMVPMGHNDMVAGTPAFVAPEVVHRSALDGRADLFSLGATLYYALTRRAAFPAREFGALQELWQRRPAPPSSFNRQIPAALDTLTLNLLSPDPAMRPRNAFEVMQRLSAIAGLEHDEPLVSQAYLATPTLVARESTLLALTTALERARSRHGSVCLLRGEAGLGRSRILDACALDAKARGAIVLRASAARASGAAFTVARTLAEQLLETARDLAVESARTEGLLATLFESVPDPMALRSGSSPQLKRSEDDLAEGERLDAYLRWFLRASKHALIVIAVDDIQRCDSASASLLAALAARAAPQCLFMALTIENGARMNAPDAIEVLAEYCDTLALEPLTRTKTEELLSSVFGSVPNVGALTEVIHERARGNPRACMDLIRYLVDRGALRYADGSWTLPERLDPAVLPKSADEAQQARIGRLDPLSRWLAQAHALSLLESLSRDDYAALRPDADHRSIDGALLQLLSEEVLTSDGLHYTLARRDLSSLLTAELDDREKRARHAALARLYELRYPLASAHHLFSSGEAALGLSRLLAFIESAPREMLRLWELSGRMRPEDLVAIFDRARDLAIQHKRTPRERGVISGWVVVMSMISDDSYYRKCADQWRTQLEQDSGLALYRELTHIADPNARLMQALTAASERHAQTSQAERGYSPEEAIHLLAIYVGITIAIASRAYDRTLMSSLDGLLDPFVTLSPMLDAIQRNAVASIEILGERLEQALARWRDVYKKLELIDEVAIPAVIGFRGAIAYAIGLVDARLGLDSANDWTEFLSRDPTQRVNALYLHKVTSLHRGDFEAAERWRKQAEVLALQTPMRQMFTNVVFAELWAHAAACDLVGVKQALERIKPLSARYPGWVAVHALAEAQFQFLRGDLAAASLEFEHCLALSAPDPREPGRTIVAWPHAVAGYVETLLRLGRATEARAIADEALGRCRELGMFAASHGIARGLALAEAKLGDRDAAWARLEQVLEEQKQTCVKGLPLGLTYEACTRLAIWFADEERLQRYAHLTANEYRYGRGSPLGARYDRLMEEARGAGLDALPELTEFASTAMPVTRAETRDPMTTHVLETMVGAQSREQRARRALRMLSQARAANAGHLYLCTGRGIVLAASEGGEPPEGLREFLERCLRADEEAYDNATSIADASELARATQAPSFRDSQGAVYHPLLLNGEVDGEMRQVAIASLVFDEEPAVPQQAQLRTAIANYLLEVGDAGGLGHADSVASGR